MKKYFLSAVVLGLTVGGPVNAVASNYCEDWGTQSTNHYDLSKCTNETVKYMGDDGNCATLDDMYTVVWRYEDGTCYYIKSCATCPSGYERKYDEDTYVVYDDFCYNPKNEDELKAMFVDRYKCVATCNCPKDVDWTAYSTGYEKSIEYTCDNGTCAAKTQYRCAVGYWGSTTNGTSGCTRCPSSGGVYGTTKYGGSTKQTSCYLPAGTAFSDSTGSGIYDTDCYWKD